MPIPKKKQSNQNSSPPKAAKKFSVTLYSGEGYGEKIVVYSESGMGKSTLGMQAPDPVFIPLDAGVMKLRHPHTGSA